MSDNQTIAYLNYAFKQAIDKASPVLGRDNTVGTKLYEYQVDFSYIINDIVNGPQCLEPKEIVKAHKLIQEINQLTT